MIPPTACIEWNSKRQGVLCLKGNIEERACQLALYIIENRATVRAAAGKFGISKSTVHKDLSERLPTFNQPLYFQVKAVLEENKAQRHIRGGLATRKKYKGE
jgi:putative DeoR family transcriptional regulator (stage III sporulation protein D)